MVEVDIFRKGERRPCPVLVVHEEQQSGLEGAQLCRPGWSRRSLQQTPLSRATRHSYPLLWRSRTWHNQQMMGVQKGKKNKLLWSSVSQWIDNAACSLGENARLGRQHLRPETWLLCGFQTRRVLGLELSLFCVRIDSTRMLSSTWAPVQIWIDTKFAVLELANSAVWHSYLTGVPRG